MAQYDWDKMFSPDSLNDQGSDTSTPDTGNGQGTDGTNWESEFSPDTPSAPAPQTDGGVDEGDRTRAGAMVGLPTPTPNMFADMDDTDAMTFYQAYKNSPDSTTDESGQLLYRGVPVPSPEDQGGAGSMQTAVRSALHSTPLGGILDMTNAAGAGYVEDTLAGGLGGVWNAGKEAATLGGNLVDYMLPGEGNQVSQAIENNVPEFNPKGGMQHAGTGVGQIGAGIWAGNEVGAALKASGMAPAAIAKITQAAPKAVDYITNVLAGAVGIGATSSPNSDTLVAGENAWLPLIKGLDTEGPDQALNTLKQRVNIVMDNIIVGGAAYGAGKTLAAMKKFGYEVFGKHFQRLASDNAQEYAIIEEIADSANHVTGASTPEQQMGVFQKIRGILSDPKNSKIFYDVNIPGVENPDVALDTASTFSKGANLANEEDKALARVFRQERKKVIFPRGNEMNTGTRTLEASERPAEALNNLVAQTSEVFDKGGKVQDAAKAIQTEANVQSQAATDLAGSKAQEAENTLDQMGKNTREYIDTKKGYVKTAYGDIPPETPADRSFDELASSMNLPKNLQKTIDGSDGSFKYLNNTVRPVVQKALNNVYEQLRRSPGDKTLEGLADDLKSLKNNIDVDQPTALLEHGNINTLRARDEALQSFKDNEVPLREGVTQKVQDVIDKYGSKNTTDVPVQTRNALRPVVEEPVRNKEYYDQLKKVLESPEGKTSSDLLTKFKDAKEQQQAAEELANDVFKNHFREFFDLGTNFKTPLPSGINSFKDLIENPQGLDRIKNLKKLADEKGIPIIHDALKSAYSQVIDDVLFKGDISQTGAEKVSKAAGSLERDKALLEAGKEIFGDIPEWGKAMTGLLDAAKVVNADNFLRAAKSGEIDFVKTEASAAFQKLIRAWKGPLTKAGTRYNTIFSAVLKFIKPQQAILNMKDSLMADPEAFVKAMDRFMDVKLGRAKTNLPVLSQALASMGVINDGDRNKWEKEYNKMNGFDYETDSVFDTLVKGAQDVEQTISDQTSKYFGR